MALIRESHDPEVHEWLTGLLTPQSALRAHRARIASRMGGG